MLPDNEEKLAKIRKWVRLCHVLKRYWFVMKNLFAALTVILTASTSFAEEYLECKPIHAVKWQLEDDDYGGKKGFREMDVSKYPDGQITLVRGLLVFSNMSRPYVMEPDFIERDYNGKVEAVSYRRREREWAGGIQFIFDDPDCSEYPRSKLSAMFLGVDQYVNQLYDCDCLSSADQSELFD